jgi:acyl-CoA dehydrogenase
MDETTKRPNQALVANARRSPFFTEEHEMLRDQVRRFVEEEIKPHGDAWEA